MRINTFDLKEVSPCLNAGEKILLTGYIYTARDAAHKRLLEILKGGGLMPFELKHSVIYYAGPTGTPFNMPIGSCGPTTSSRMDRFTPQLLDLGVAATIGKGERSEGVIESIKKNRAVYFAAIGGCGALVAECVKSAEVIAFPELGCESIKRLFVEDFPLITAIDSFGISIYTQGRKRYCKYKID